VRLQDKQYEQAGRQSTSRVTMDSMLAARKAEKEGVKTTQADTKVGDDRPKI
jgi:hypothetical protein